MQLCLSCGQTHVATTPFCSTCSQVLLKPIREYIHSKLETIDNLSDLVTTNRGVFQDHMNLVLGLRMGIKIPAGKEYPRDYHSFYAGVRELLILEIEKTKKRLQD